MEGPEDPGQVATAQRRYRALLDHMSEGFVVCEAIRDATGRLVDYRLLEANPIYLERAPPEAAIVGRRQLELRPATPPQWFEACDVALRGRPVRFEFRDPLNERWYEVHMMRLSDHEIGQLFVDMTSRKRAEERQAQLFEELNHRVKNNLSVVSAILALQARSSPEAVCEQLERARDRIAAIADLHAALYTQESTHDVALCAYIQDIADRLAIALGEQGALRIETHCDDVSLPVSHAVSVGLIVNELVTNAAKHAFAPGGRGWIRIDLRRADDRISLTVSDNGRGAGATAFGAGAGLGTRIVQALASDLQGEVHRLDGPGTVIRVAFPPPATDAAAP